MAVQIIRISFEFGNGSRMTDKKLVILEFKYLQSRTSMCHSCSNHSNLEMEAEFLMKDLSCLNLNISRTKNGRNKL